MFGKNCVKSNTTLKKLIIKIHIPLPTTTIIYVEKPRLKKLHLWGFIAVILAFVKIACPVFRVYTHTPAPYIFIALAYATFINITGLCFIMNQEEIPKEQIIRDFEDFIEGLSENTKMAYMRYVQQFATTDPREFNHTVAQMIREAKSYSTKNQIWASANKFTRFIRKVYQKRNFELWIERPKSVKKLPTYLTPDEVKLLIDAEPSPKYKTILEVLFSTGIRVSELVNLTLKDVDLVEHKIKIREEIKNNQEREVPIPKKVAVDLRNYIKKYRKDGSEYLFTSRTGKKMTRSEIWKHIQRLVKKVGMKKKVTPHTFRHTFATYLLMKGRSLREIQELLGHKSIDSTIIYTHVVNEMKKESAKTFDDVLE